MNATVATKEKVPVSSPEKTPVISLMEMHSRQKQVPDLRTGIQFASWAKGLEEPDEFDDLLVKFITGKIEHDVLLEYIELIENPSDAARKKFDKILEVKPPISFEELLERLENAVEAKASVELEGATLSAEYEELDARYVAGEIERSVLSDYCDSLRKKYANGN
jgi:hypothetical protein